MERSIILIGNPNVGKSVIFGALTGRYATVSNYPGTTVEITRGMMPDGTPVIDTPGTNTLFSKSDDEAVTRDLLIAACRPGVTVVQVADVKNLSRALLLTAQLAEFGFPMVLVLNMMDEAEARGVRVDMAGLAARLGIDVIPFIATRGDGLDALRAAIPRARRPAFHPAYDTPLEAAVCRVAGLLPEQVGARGLALQLLSGNEALADRFSLNGYLHAISDGVAFEFARPARTAITMQQMSGAQALAASVLDYGGRARRDRWQLSRWTVHPLWGWPILAVVLFVMYKLVGEFGGGTAVDFMEGTVFGEWINPAATRLVEALVSVPLLRDLLVGEYGVITMALSYGLGLVLPIVTMFFLAFAVLEDSGYLPRLAVMLNRAFKVMGLNGKAVLPMILGLGCDTMATMSTRILETRRERILVTLLLALGVPCSAQLGVILGMMGTISSAGVVLWAAVVVGVMLGVGFLAAKLLPGEKSDFILELPPIRLPRLGNILIKTAARVEWYLKEVLPLFVVGTLILFVVDRVGLLGTIEQVASPLVVGFLGLPAAATGAFLIGFLRRDYGAAGLFALALDGQMTMAQIVVSMIVITLFIPCIANVLMIFKEYGAKVTLGVVATVFPLAFAVGGLVNLVLQALQVRL